MRIAILDTYDRPITFIDNTRKTALHYWDDELHNYLQGTASSFSFNTTTGHEDSEHLKVGNKLAFVFRGRDYYMNIVKVKDSESSIEVTAHSSTLELINEEKDSYKATKAMSFAEYFNVFDSEHILTLNLNEVSDKKLSIEWQGRETFLSRLFSLAKTFDAEIEFLPKLNDNYSLNSMVVNVYKENSEQYQGIGNDRTDETLRYGKDINGIEREIDITELYTSIRPVGEKNTTISSKEYEEKDEDGNVLFFTKKGSNIIYAPQARDRFPSNVLSAETDRYINKWWDYQTTNVNTLFGQALAQLKSNCEPKVKYEVAGNVYADVGDTFRIQDEGFTPPLYLRARATEMVISTTNPDKNKTVFDNFFELKSEISEDLMKRVEQLIEMNKQYKTKLSTDNGNIFKNSEGQTTLTAEVTLGEETVEGLTYTWKINGEVI